MSRSVSPGPASSHGGTSPPGMCAVIETTPSTGRAPRRIKCNMSACRDTKKECQKLQDKVTSLQAEVERLKRSVRMEAEGEVRRVHGELVSALSERDEATRLEGRALVKRNYAYSELVKAAKERQQLILEKTELASQLKDAVAAAAAVAKREKDAAAAAAVAERLERRQHTKELVATQAESQRLADEASQYMLTAGIEQRAAEDRVRSANQKAATMELRLTG